MEALLETGWQGREGAKRRHISAARSTDSKTIRRCRLGTWASHGLSTGNRQQEYLELEHAAVAGHAAGGDRVRGDQHQSAGAGQEGADPAYSPSGKVPALVVDDPAAGGFVVWDTLAILEYLAETHPGARLWPEQAMARAHARAVSAEMHAGFQAAARALPHGPAGANAPGATREPVAADVRRIVCHLARMSGPVRRRRGVPVRVVQRGRRHVRAGGLALPHLHPDLAAYGDDGTAAAYVAAIFALPELAEWEQGAREQVEATQLAARGGDRSGAWPTQFSSSPPTARMMAGRVSSTAAASQRLSETAVLALRPRMRS